MSIWNPAVEFGSPRPALRGIWWGLWVVFAVFALTAQLVGTWLTYTRPAILQKPEYRVPDWWWAVDLIFNPLVGAVAAALAVCAAALLLWRRSECGFAIFLAFGLVSLALADSQSANFLQWIGWDLLAFALLMIAAPVLMMAFPAFPDGRYRPAWARWLRLTPWAVAAWFAAAILTDADLNSAIWALLPLFFLQIGVSTFATYRRYRMTTDRRERQQLKWAAFGFVLGLPLMFSTWVAVYFPDPASDTVAVVRDLVLMILSSAGQILVPLGVLLSLLGIRLNDADVAIGRSAGYALVTILVGAVWAASTTWMDTLVKDQTTRHTAAGISALLAAALFIPLRDRVLAWTERRIQPALVRLRGLPARINPLMHDHSPSDLANGALAAIANGVQASRAAIVSFDGERRNMLAFYKTDEAAVIADLARDPDADDEFPVHIPLADLCGEVGVLLVGRRTDGASFNSDQRAALQLVKAPLAEALRATSRRAARNAALAAAVAAIEARVARLEGGEPEPAMISATPAPNAG